MHIKREAKSNKKTFQELEKENNNTNSEVTETTEETNEIIDPTDLIKYISLGDFSKVKNSIKHQIKQDQQNYNNDIADSLKQLDNSVKTFTKANEDLISILTTINNLLAYTKGKDYFISGFNDVKFEVSSDNNNSLQNGVELISNLIGNSEVMELLNGISSNNLIASNYVTKPLESKTDNNILQESQVVESDNEEIEENTENNSFDIRGNFESETTEINIEQNTEEKITESENETKISEDNEEKIIEDDKDTFDISSNFGDFTSDEEFKDDSVDNEIEEKMEEIDDDEIDTPFGETVNTELDKEVLQESQVIESDNEEIEENTENNSFDIRGNFESETTEINIEQNTEEKITESENETKISEDNEEKIIEDDKDTFDISSNFGDFTSDEEFKDDSVNNEKQKTDNDDSFGFKDDELDMEEFETPSKSEKVSIPVFANFESLDDYSFEDEEDNNKTTSNSNQHHEEPERREAFKISM